MNHYEQVLQSFEPRLLETKPQPYFHPDQTLVTEEIRFHIRRRRSVSERRVAMRGEILREQDREILHAYIDVFIPDDVDFGSPELQGIINDRVIEFARRAALGHLIPLAKELAGKIRRKPLLWDISTAKRQLGCCNSEGVIRLSCRLMFLPVHLREYVIYHELAHLSEMNHSPRFHQLCNEYCGGRERELERELKSFKFPVF